MLVPAGAARKDSLLPATEVRIQGILAESVRAVTDAAGEYTALAVPLAGRARVARFYLQAARNRRAAGARTELCFVNGLPAALITLERPVRRQGAAQPCYAFAAAFALALGAGPGAFAVYRLAVALSGLAEHANVRLPPRLDTALSLVFTWPNLHKVHHSRDPRLTDTNYGNIVSWWDRVFGTFTPATQGANVACGLDGFDDAATQTTAGLLAVPFRGEWGGLRTPARSASRS
jgi:hypothetical protein